MSMSTKNTFNQHSFSYGCRKWRRQFFFKFIYCSIYFKSKFVFLFYSNSRVVERELNVPLPISKIIKKWNNLLQEYKVSFPDLSLI